MIHYGEKIKNLRKERNISQLSLSEKIGLPQTSISSYEKYPEPPLDFIRKSLEFLAPEMKLYEFIADPEDLEKYIPSWIMPEDLEMLRALYDLPLEVRIEIRKLWIQGLETVLSALEKGK